MLALHLLTVSTLMLAPLLAQADHPAHRLVGEGDGLANEILIDDDDDDDDDDHDEKIRDTGEGSIVENTGNVYIKKAADGMVHVFLHVSSCHSGPFCHSSDNFSCQI